MPAAWPVWLICRAAARGLHTAGAFVTFGTMLLTIVLLPAPSAARLRRVMIRLVWGATALTMGAGLIWFALQTVNMADPASLAEFVTAIPLVAATRFGELLTLRCLLLIGVAVWVTRGRNPVLALLLAGAAVAGQAWLDHGGAMTGPTGTALLVSDVFHLLGGAAWIGSLPALWLAIARLPLDEAALLARRYSPMAMVAVAALTVSAGVQGVLLVGSVGALWQTGYGRIVLIKIGLLAALLGFAAYNRARLVPALSTGLCPARTALRRTVACETLLGLAALLAAALLLNLDPPTMAAMLHAEGGS
jgi:putative copper export protein